LQVAFEIIVRRPGKPDRTVPLVPGVTLLGRSEDCDVQLADIGVSRKHARLHIRPDQIFIEDLGGSNGTFLRGKRISGTTPLAQGDIVVIEPFSVELRSGPAAFTPPTPEARREAHARVDVISGPSLAQGSYLVGPAGLSIGRSEYRDLVILDPAASRHHCDIILQNAKWRLVDNGSSNGIFLNDQRVLDARLSHGDVLRVGNTELRFIDLGADGAKGSPAPPAAPVAPRPEPSRDATAELSLPLPDALDVTPKVRDDIDHFPSAADTDRLARPIVPWLPVSIGFVGVALLTLTATLATGLLVLLLLPKGPTIHVPTQAPPKPPTWTVSGARADASVEQLFADGIAAMRARKPGDALPSFHRVLVLEPGNRAAERLSYTAGEHLLASALEAEMRAATTAKSALDAERDALLAAWPRRAAAAALQERFRDDPLVLATTGWTPSAAEVELAARIDEAIKLGNEGRWPEARSGFEEALRQTRNPVLKERARLGRDAARLALARAASSAWRAGVAKEHAGDVAGARSAYERALVHDPTQAAARIRLARLPAGAP
jgi:pSer/pThr/pTyr-binding forkhead associated (FHA) protein